MKRFLSRIAAAYLSRQGHNQRRYTVRERARQMCIELGKPVPKALRK